MHSKLRSCFIAFGLVFLLCGDLSSQAPKWSETAIGDTLARLVGLPAGRPVTLYPMRDRLWPWALFYRLDARPTSHSPDGVASVVIVRDSLFPIRSLQDLSPVWRVLPSSPDVTGSTLGWMCLNLLVDAGFLGRWARDVERRGELPDGAGERVGRARWASGTARFLQNRSETAQRWTQLVWDRASLLGVECRIESDWGLTIRIDSVFVASDR